MQWYHLQLTSATGLFLQECCWMKMLGDRFRSCLGLTLCSSCNKEPMSILTGSLALKSNLLGVASCAQKPCKVLGEIGQICPLKHSDNVPGWATFQSLGTLADIFQFSSSDMAFAITRVIYILISQMPVLKSYLYQQSLELCASYICCQ